ncbi:MAG: M23 family metallopeptidase [Daejeonella sp.]
MLKLKSKITPLLLLIILFMIGFTLKVNIQDGDREIIIPVKGASKNDWDAKSFWHYPWGKSITHKGIDIFKPLNTPVISPTAGIIIQTGYNINGGNYIYLLGSKSRIYYFAHLNKSLVHDYSLIKKEQIIGLVGDSGNAKNAPFHLHFSIFSILPVFKYYDSKAPLGWKKIFYLNPETYFLP